MKLSSCLASITSLLVVAACGDDAKTTDTTSADTSAVDTGTADTTVAETTGTDTGGDDDATVAADTQVEDTGVAVDTAITDTAAPDTSSSCDRNGFTAVAQDAVKLSGAFLYFAQSSLGSPVDTLNFELVPTNGGATTATSVSVGGENYADCGNCVLAYVGCDDNLDNCQKVFLAQSGNLTISKFDESGGQFTGTLTNLVLAEVTVAEDFTSTPVVDGDTWCIDSYAFDVEVQ